MVTSMEMNIKVKNKINKVRNVRDNVKIFNLNDGVSNSSKGRIFLFIKVSVKSKYVDSLLEDFYCFMF